MRERISACAESFSPAAPAPGFTPITQATSKQLVPVYDKPMIYYPLSTLMLAGIRDVLVITTPHEQDAFVRLLGDGSQFGIAISYATQPEPKGLAQAFTIGAEFASGHKTCLCWATTSSMAPVSAPSWRGWPTSKVPQYSATGGRPDGLRCGRSRSHGKALSIEEKPANPKSHYAVPGLYFYDETVWTWRPTSPRRHAGSTRSPTSIVTNLERGELSVSILPRGTAWLDTGTFDSLIEASDFVRTIQARQGLKIGCPEEVAWRKGFLSDQELLARGVALEKSGYGKYLQDLLVAARLSRPRFEVWESVEGKLSGGDSGLGCR